MSYIHEQNHSYDVVIVGGGMSGICAAIASARGGARTALIQNRSMLGGNASSEIRMHIVGASCHNSKPDMMETGILLELLLENKRRNPYHTFSVWDTILWEKVRWQEGLDLYLNTCLETAETENSTILSIRCYQNTTETMYTFSAKIFVDATGHGTLGVLAGAESRMGSEGKAEFGEPGAPDEPNTDTMGNSLMFQAVDRGEPVEFVCPDWAYHFTEEDLRYRTHVDKVTSIDDPTGNKKNLPDFYNLDSGYWWIELGGQYADIIEDAETIRDELTRCVYGVWDHIKNVGDHGAENYDLSWVGFIPGYRESRRLEGKYILTEHDVRGNRIFDDAVAYGGWPMDEHVRGGILDFDKLPSRVFSFDGSYTIPYRCYCSKNVENLMMAGRDISASKMAFGSIRVMGTCAVGGQAVGTAAAMAALRGVTPGMLAEDITALQQQLLKDDCYIPGFAGCDPADKARHARASASSALPGREAANVLNGIARKVDDAENCWESDSLAEGPQSLTLTLPSVEKLTELRLTFDPNLSREIMPSITATVRNRQCKGMPDELVRDYDVIFTKAGEQVFRKEIRGNYQRLNVIPLPENIEADELTILVRATHGHPSARIFEVRLY
ncbi:MAG: FAD-dependent oxidoreductase [Oscillospiraceae bacterium]|nr:FAD-dependent oxidoreductase [Oscillospiraceae bacterium]